MGCAVDIAPVDAGGCDVVLASEDGEDLFDSQELAGSGKMYNYDDWGQICQNECR